MSTEIYFIFLKQNIICFITFNIDWKIMDVFTNEKDIENISISNTFS